MGKPFYRCAVGNLKPGEVCLCRPCENLRRELGSNGTAVRKEVVDWGQRAHGSKIMRDALNAPKVSDLERETDAER